MPPLRGLGRRARGRPAGPGAVAAVAAAVAVAARDGEQPGGMPWTAVHQWTPLSANITLVQPPEVRKRRQRRRRTSEGAANVSSRWRILHLTDAHISLAEGQVGTRRMHNDFRVAQAVCAAAFAALRDSWTSKEQTKLGSNVKSGATRLGRSLVDDGMGWVGLTADMSPSGLPVQLYPYMACGKRPLPIAQGLVTSMHAELQVLDAWAVLGGGTGAVLIATLGFDGNLRPAVTHVGRTERMSEWEPPSNLYILSDPAELKAELFVLLEASPDLAEAGPKAVLEALKKRDGRWASVSAPKCKRVLQQVRAELAERAAAALKRRATAFDCPGGHGLVRFAASHGSFCCDVCRVYQPLLAGMWGCRKCDWDVCEARCRPKDSQSLVDLDATFRSLELRTGEAAALAPAEAKAGLAQVEAEVHALEKALDSKDLAALAELERTSGRGPTSEEALRAERKRLLAATEGLLDRIEASFKEVRAAAAGQAAEAGSAAAPPPAPTSAPPAGGDGGGEA
ncbi:unnamed protein product [Prorocentrum cordatum]|uniref:Uncharacterized protein n=1 Tax=Prorocentrum cordatum TaxID=2364126 RepID=A0ABN9U6M3_9DINO|nr:unnamed protein product [Polarella glacialis]